MNDKRNIPVTRDFNDKNAIGSLNLSIDQDTMDMIANGLLTFSVGYIAPFPDGNDEQIVYKNAELVELSLIPTQNYINHLKQKGLYNDNDNNTGSVKG